MRRRDIVKDKERPDLREVVRTLIVQADATARVLECYYWTEEPGLLECLRALLSMPPEARGALQTFLGAVENPKSISAAVDGSGALKLFSPDAAKTMATFFADGRPDGPASRVPS
jgi:hypothetical protein